MAINGRHLSAAINGYGPLSGKAHLFLGGSYVRYDWGNDAVDDGYPVSISSWKLPLGFDMELDAALNGCGPKQGKAYFFKDGWYVRYDLERNIVDNPVLQTSLWGLTGDFGGAIDGAFNGHGSREGKAYFLRGDHYVRYDWATDKVDSAARPLSDWGLSGDFASGVDAVLEGAGSFANRLYFFKGDQYVRYDWTLGKLDHEGTIHINAWKGAFQMLCYGEAKARAMAWIGTGLDYLDDYLNPRGAGGAGATNHVVIDAALATHFHVQSGWDATKKFQYLNSVRATYAAALAALGRSVEITHYDDTCAAPSQTVTYGDGAIKIFVGPCFLDYGPLCQTAMTAHEPVHFVDAKAVQALDVYEHSPAYASLTSDQAIHSPGAFVAFAEHLYYGDDRRYGVKYPEL